MSELERIITEKIKEGRKRIIADKVKCDELLVLFGHYPNDIYYEINKKSFIYVYQIHERKVYFFWKKSYRQRLFEIIPNGDMWQVFDEGEYRDFTIDEVLELMSDRIISWGIIK